MSPIIPPDIQPASTSDLADSDIRAKLIDLLGLAKVPDQVDFTTSETHETEDIRVTHLSYQNSLRETVPAILMEPLTFLLARGCCLFGWTGLLWDRDGKP